MLGACYHCFHILIEQIFFFFHASLISTDVDNFATFAISLLKFFS